MALGRLALALALAVLDGAVLLEPRAVPTSRSSQRRAVCPGLGALVRRYPYHERRPPALARPRLLGHDEDVARLSPFA